MNQEISKCETTDSFACEEEEEEDVAKMCELDQAKTYKGLVGIFVDEIKIFPPPCLHRAQPSRRGRVRVGVGVNDYPDFSFLETIVSQAV